MTDATSNRFAVDAPAKINLYLHVTGRRDDGYHLLDSLVGFTAYGDRLSAIPGENLTLNIEGPFAGELGDANDDNLILKAARALRQASGGSSGAALTLVKNLPVSSGIGGGSADAAAALRVLSKLWGVDESVVRLPETGLAIGADVPVCLAGVPAHMSGIGEIVTPVRPMPPCGVVLVNAREAVSTPAVFKARSGGYSSPVDWMGASGFDDFVKALRIRRNDLAAPAAQVSPVTEDILTMLASFETCALARLSGSGGTCFGLFADTARAEEAAAAVSASRPDWWCVSTTFRDTRAAVETGPAGG